MSIILSWIILAPLFSSILVGFLYLYSITKKPLNKAFFTVPALLSPALSFVMAVGAFIYVARYDVPLTYAPYDWLNVGEYKIVM